MVQVQVELTPNLDFTLPNLPYSQSYSIALQQIWPKLLQKKLTISKILDQNQQSTFVLNQPFLHPATNKTMKKQSSTRQEKLQLFLSKYKKHLSNQIKQLQNQQNHTFDLQKIKSTIIADNDQHDLKQAALRLNSGELVAFPTETVYGLGANALNQMALIKIYQTKRRPLSDPIIVHILQPEDTFKYVEISEEQKIYFQILTKAFWPGPMTVILKANLNVLPIVVTAQTGFVGIRCPNHQYFRKLLKRAPSANLFSHVSPTQSVHVFNDFYKDDVWVVDGGKCEFGIQSTVLKILDNQIKIFRQGSLSVNKITEALTKVLGLKAPRVQIIKKTVSHQQNMEAPGQLLKHYSPNLPCEYVQSPEQLKKISPQKLVKIGLISFSHELYGQFASNAGAYFEVGKTISLPQDFQNEQQQKFCTYEQKIKMRQIYFLLRQAENLPLEKIVIAWNGPKEGTIWDKIFRATQGKIYISQN